jgi:hypothetical protein
LATARVAGEQKLVATERQIRDAAKLLALTLFPV